MSIPDSSYSGSHIATPIFANNVTWSCSGCISFARANISTHVAHTSCLPNLHAGEMLGQIAQPERQVGTQLQVLQNVAFCIFCPDEPYNIFIEQSHENNSYCVHILSWTCRSKIFQYSSSWTRLHKHQNIVLKALSLNCEFAYFRNIRSRIIASCKLEICLNIEIKLLIFQTFSDVRQNKHSNGIKEHTKRK